MEASWGLSGVFGRRLATSWEGFGVARGASPASLEQSWGSWDLLGVLGAALGASWGFLGKLLGVSGEHLGASWGCLGASWRGFFRLLAVLEGISHSLSVSEWFGIVLGTIFH